MLLFQTEYLKKQEIRDDNQVGEPAMVSILDILSVLVPLNI